MTNSRQEDDDLTWLAMRRVGEALAEGSDAERVFLEERSDLRLVLGSEDRRDLTVTRSRGAAIDGRDSIHLTDPSFDELVELAHRPMDGTLAPPTSGWSLMSAGSAWEFNREWLSPRESVVVAQAERAAAATTDGRWSATLVAFHQKIWVALRDGQVVGDLRRGCRVEFKVWLGRYPNTMVVADCVLGVHTPTLPEGILDRVLERVSEKRRLLPPPGPGATCAVLAPGVGGVVIHELVGHALEGDANRERRTWLHGVRSRPPRSVTVIDDPGRGRGAWAVDDEGVPSEPIVLVADGKPVGSLLDRTAAEALGRSSTGHGRRSSYLTPPRARMGCTWVAPGADDPSDVLRDTNAGVFIRRMVAGHTDPYAGRASFVVSEADQIVAGRLGGPLEPFVIELDGIEAWGSIDRVGSDLAFDTCVGSCVRDGQPLAVSVGAPTIRIGVMRVVS